MPVSNFRSSLLALLVSGLVLWLGLGSSQTPPASTGDAGCVSCHTQTDSATMHTTGTVSLSCTQCHGGDGQVFRPPIADTSSAPYRQAKLRAHPQPKNSEWAEKSANPVRPSAAWLQESLEYI